MKKNPIEAALSSTGMDFSIYGRNKADRFTDEELARVAEFPAIASVCLANQAITKLPPFVAPKKLQLWNLPQLTSLAGIERMVSLESVSLSDQLCIAADTYKRLAELPELTRLDLAPPAGGSLPAAIAKLPSVLSIELISPKDFDLEGALAQLAKLPTLRSLKIDRLEGPVPDSLGKLVRLERLEILGKVTALPKTIGKLRALTYLDVRFNKIKDLPEELWNLTALEHLDVCYNPIKILSPKIAQLRALASLDLGLTYIHTIPKELGQLANLRQLVTAQKMKEMPAEVYALQLDRYRGPHDKFTLREVEVPDESELTLHDPERIPASFGQPKKLEIRWSGKTPPLTQLAACTRLRQLSVEVSDLATILPHVPAQLVSLFLSCESFTGTLPVLPDLESLGLYLPKAKDLFVGYPELADLFFNAPGVPAGLARTKLTTLRLANCQAPPLRELTDLPLTHVEMRGVKNLDVEALCDVLATKSLTTLEFMFTKLRTVPAAIAKLSVKQLGLVDTGITSLPPEIGQIRGLEILEIPAMPFDKKLLPGRWKVKKWGSR
ncbi:MAG TPA: hypothetical protein VGC41_16090 [Kofleriaceae bacterium]